MKYGMYFVGTVRQNVSASVVFEIIYRMLKMFRDYCGVLSEEAIRKNFVLIYEIIDEALDYGHSQFMTTEAIRPFMVNEPIIVSSKKGGSKTPQPKKTSWKPRFFKSTTQSASAITRPM